LLIALVISIVVILFAKSRIFPSKRILREWVRRRKRKGLKVLLIEDELLHAGLVKRELEKAGHDLEGLVHVISGKRGLEILQKETFDLVLLDYPLPGMNVTDFLKKTRAMSLDIPVFTITGQQSVRVAMKAVELGSYDYILESDLLSPEYAAALLGVPYRTIQNYILTGRVKTYKGPGGQHCIRREDIMNLRFLERGLLRSELYRSYVDTLGALTDAIDARDGITSGHSRRVAAYVAALIERMGISGEEQENIKLAALLHDVGKVFISEQTLNKPAELTDQERYLIRQHPLMGERIASRVELLKGGSSLIRNHHERYDGKGYPDGLSGGKIPQGARIISLAESFDCITSDCTYRRGKSLGEAIEEIEAGTGTQFDPEIVGVFLENKDEVTLRPLLN
jgi:excisionase family DNA binding protein